MRYKKSFCKIHSIRLASHLWRLIAIDLLLYCPTCQCIYRTFCKYTGFTDSVCLQTALLKLFTDSNIEIVYRQRIQTALLKLFLHTALTDSIIEIVSTHSVYRCECTTNGFRVQGLGLPWVDTSVRFQTLRIKASTNYNQGTWLARTL